MLNAVDIGANAGHNGSGERRDDIRGRCVLGGLDCSDREAGKCRGSRDENGGTVGPIGQPPTRVLFIG